jgi:hypothetical protein
MHRPWDERQRRDLPSARRSPGRRSSHPPALPPRFTLPPTTGAPRRRCSAMCAGWVAGRRSPR